MESLNKGFSKSVSCLAFKIKLLVLYPKWHHFHFGFVLIQGIYHLDECHFSSKPKALATLGVYRKLVHIPKVYHKKEVVRNCEKQIKKGVLMINTSRGEIIDTNALFEGIAKWHYWWSRQFDSFCKNEQEVIHIDHNYNVIKNLDLLLLKAYLNVIVTPHADPFYTDQVSYDMVHCSLESLKNLVNNQECRYQLN